MSQLKAAVQSLDKAIQASKSPAQPQDHLRALREWRMAATLRFTGKSVTAAKKVRGK